MPLRITVYTNFPSSFPTLSPTHCSQTSACTLSLRPASQGLQPNAKPNSYFHLSRCARSFWHRWPLLPSRNSPVLDLKYLVWPSSLLDLPLLLWTPFCSLLTGYFFSTISRQKQYNGLSLSFLPLPFWTLQFHSQHCCTESFPKH